MIYNNGSKVDDTRQVLRLGKSVDESAHLRCGVSFGPLPIELSPIRATPVLLCIITPSDCFCQLQKEFFYE